MMDLKKIKSELKTNWLGKNIHYTAETESTSLAAKKAAQAGAHRGELFLSEFQTKGYGRMNRSWESSAGQNLLLSFIDQAPSPEKVFQLTLVAGVAFFAGLRKLFPAIPLKLKWPNDIFLNSKKMGGIICEHDTATSWVIIGVGLNINQSPSDLSDPLQNDATSLAAYLGHEVDREQVLISCLEEYEKWRASFDRRGVSGLLSYWKEHSFIVGRKIRVIDGSETFEGVAKGLDDQGFLVVKVGMEMKTVITGDIQILSEVA